MSRLRKTAVAALVVLPFVAACAVTENPATGQRQATFITPEEEIEIGRENHPQILRQFGGAYQNEEVTAYVDRVGERLKANSELPDLDFTFTVLNSEVVNAFALPGGYIYISRGLLALAENEAEMAGVLAHEIGHVTARHSALRDRSAKVGGIFANAAAIGSAILFGGEAGQVVGQLAGVGAQATVQGFSRSQELEADQLGVRYLSRTGYDPNAMSSFLEKLQENDRLTKLRAGRDPNEDNFSFLASHPRTAERVEAAAEAAADKTPSPTRNREPFLEKIDGIVYGTDPSQGVVRETAFIHPDLRFSFDFPEGMVINNTPNAVIGQFNNTYLMQFDLDTVPTSTDLADYVANDFREGLRVGAVDRRTINGMPAATGSAAVRFQGKDAEIVAAAIRYEGERVYRFLFLRPGSWTSAEGRDVYGTIESFRKISASEAAELKPLRLRLVTVQRGDTVDSLAARMEVEAFKKETFLTLNALDEGDSLAAGETVKLVTY
ncbi:MAG: M48 family metalloprotease [Geminicoccaceae bacterium]